MLPLDALVYPPTGSKASAREMNTPPTLQGIALFTFTFTMLTKPLML